MSVLTKRTHQEFKTDKILDKRTPLTSTNGSKCCQSTFQGGFSAPVSSSVRRRLPSLVVTARMKYRYRFFVFATVKTVNDKALQNILGINYTYLYLISSFEMEFFFRYCA